MTIRHGFHRLAFALACLLAAVILSGIAVAEALYETARAGLWRRRK